MPAKNSGEQTRNKLVEAAIDLARIKGYSAMRVEDVCARAGVTKGAFFHYFLSKDALGVAAANAWRENANALFAAAEYHRLEDPLERLLAYVDMRKALLAGEVYEYACYAGSTVQDTWQSQPDITAACQRAISEHAGSLIPDIEAAAAQAGLSDFDAEGLARYTQAVVQGALTLAKAEGGNATALKCFDHLRTYLELLFSGDGRVREQIQETGGRS